MSAVIRADSGLERRLRWRRRLARAADVAFGALLLATLAMALAPLAASLLRSDVRAAIEAEEAWSAEDTFGAATAMLTGRRSSGDAALPAVDRAGTAVADLR